MGLGEHQGPGGVGGKLGGKLGGEGGLVGGLGIGLVEGTEYEDCMGGGDLGEVELVAFVEEGDEIRWIIGELCQDDATAGVEVWGDEDGFLEGFDKGLEIEWCGW